MPDIIVVGNGGVALMQPFVNLFVPIKFYIITILIIHREINTLTKTSRLEYKLMYRGLLFLADQTQTESYRMVWGLMLEGTVKQWLEVPLLNIEFRFLIR